MTPSVLVVDDDRDILTSLGRALRLEGFAVTVAADGRAALDAVDAGTPDVVVLDLGLPDIDGVVVCRRIREAGHDLPICILSARDEVPDRVGGLQAGADDYLVKPFSVDELVARIHALLRRRPAPRDRIVAGTLVIEPDTRRANLGEGPLDLTRREFDLLEALARNAGVVLSRERLLELVWGYDWEVETNAVDVFVGYLRRKTEAGGAPRLIHTVRGVGFVLRP